MILPHARDYIYIDTQVFLKELKFPSTKDTYIRDITAEVNAVVQKVKAKQGFVIVNSKHTTLGILVNEVAEPNLLHDILRHTLHTVPEDKRSTRVHPEYMYPTVDYKHRCQDNPYCDEIDEDYNAGAHIRALTFSHPSVTIPFRNGKLEIGKYQQIAIFEFDGRDGSGKNPIRQRIVQIWVYPSQTLKEL